MFHDMFVLRALCFTIHKPDLDGHSHCLDIDELIPSERWPSMVPVCRSRRESKQCLRAATLRREQREWRVVSVRGAPVRAREPTAAARSSRQSMDSARDAPGGEGTVREELRGSQHRTSFQVG